ncbi:hypothetical protein TrCOL_g48 [Triparma columacea]|uniref:ApaG domain-containing protein n=1 Tax=Triparma columacea TaxID=722753 RepID=A0A9W7L5D1_9STRA|nr:hypothetical protein TrCOL_g48 [Triparma columacea]
MGHPKNVRWGEGVTFSKDENDVDKIERFKYLSGIDTGSEEGFENVVKSIEEVTRGRTLTRSRDEIRRVIRDTFREAVSSSGNDDNTNDWEGLGLKSLSRLSTLSHELGSCSVRETNGVEVTVMSTCVEVLEHEDEEEEGEDYGDEYEEDDDTDDFIMELREEGEEVEEEEEGIDLEESSEGGSMLEVEEGYEEGINIGIPRRTYVHAYRVRVENVGEHRIQVLGRNWSTSISPPQEEEEEGEGGSVTTSEDEGKHTMLSRVRQPTGGVVGMFPVIEKGGAFEYCSGTSVSEVNAWMEGGIVVAKVGEDNKEGFVGGTRGDERFNGKVKIEDIWEAKVGGIKLRGDVGEWED